MTRSSTKTERSKKETFGGASINRFSPAFEADAPTSINMYISFEEALKLHLGLGQILGCLNQEKRSTKEGRITAVNLCVHTKNHCITINEGKIKED